MTAIVETTPDTATVLRGWFPKGATVNVVVRHVSQSGMTRHISVLMVSRDGAIRDVSGAVARALGWRFNERHGAVTVRGCGMDMGFHLVNALSRVLYAEDYALRHQWV